jgi:putative tryptophan/tyrosine transport system substrate-binding protein
MNRRAFIAGLGSTAAWPLMARAQKQHMPTIAVLTVANFEPLWTPFREKMRDLGYSEGANVRFEFRSAEGNPELLPGIAAQVVHNNVSVIVAYLTPTIAAAKHATSEIPIVMVGAGDPVATGLIASLARPGGNITGTTSAGPETGTKTLELLRDLLPSVERVAVLANASDPGAKPFLGQLQQAGEALQVQLNIIMIHAADELDPAFAAMKSSGADAVIVHPSLPRKRIGDLALKNLIPALAPAMQFASEGGLAAYSGSAPEMYRKVAVYVDKILKGSKPADLPVEQPTQYELAINLKTAKVLGITVPPTVLARADEVIE